MMFSQGHCRPSRKTGKGWGVVAEGRVALPSCLHSIAEAVNCKELKHIGHHLRHPSFQKLPLFSPLPQEKHTLHCHAWPGSWRCHFGGDTQGGGGGGRINNQPPYNTSRGRPGRLAPQGWKASFGLFCFSLDVGFEMLL